MSKHLIKYIEAMDGSWGCRDEYEREIHPGVGYDKWPWLAGHYSSLLNELISAMGRDSVLSLLRVRLNIEEKPERSPSEADVSSMADLCKGCGKDTFALGVVEGRRQAMTKEEVVIDKVPSQAATPGGDGIMASGMASGKCDVTSGPCSCGAWH